MSAKIKFVGTIPANPGFYVLSVISDDSGYPVEIDKSPVVAWALEEDSLAPYPATLEGVECKNLCILLPDGSVIRRWDEKFLSEDAWLRRQQADYTEQRRGVK